MNDTIRVVFILLPDSLALDWAGPAEVLRSANRTLLSLGLAARFRMAFAGPVADPLTSVGVGLRDIVPLPPPADLRRGGPTWVVVPGQPGERIDPARRANAAAVRWLRSLAPAAGQLELVCICAGAVLAGHAGLLDGLEVTTHHQHLDELRAAAPSARVIANRVFVPGAAVWTSAGVTTGIDLMLHRIAGSCGPVVAARVAESLVVGLRRGPGDPELSPFLSWRNHLHAGLHRVQDAVCQHPRADWSVAAMAREARTSPRHLARLFGEHAGVSPLQYLRQIRLAAAEAALRSGASVGRAAEIAGFASDGQLRRAWRQWHPEGSSPSLLRPPA